MLDINLFFIILQLRIILIISQQNWAVLKVLRKMYSKLEKKFSRVFLIFYVLKKYTQNFITVFSKLNNAKTVQKL